MFRHIRLITYFVTLASLLAGETESFEIHVFYMKKMPMRTRSSHGYGSASNYTPFRTAYSQSPRWRLGKVFEMAHDSLSSTRLEMVMKDDTQQEDTDLDTFRSLMGTLYGIAGLAHAVDCFLGSSQLLMAAESAPFFELPFLGQVVVTLWCLAGGLAFILSRRGGILADVGLVIYGLVEMLTASLSPSMTTFLNAALVQIIVFASWLYSRQKGGSRVTKE
eukprot:CAMPEP_0204629778 /NCGR_PEP_ID=MMETSP0717-20131115/18897_1 /ASSEMBLY_ACC=CAM_ASM_000666 /TAXON_ID=230516 /ORGANISM="Chaetoceros curvisetus" /LENGTH=219 /DNA_ID=CAMNT_0051646819 /DNA_START=76 /DNA_END=735 /DNA_ORIENTATION=+